MSVRRGCILGQFLKFGASPNAQDSDREDNVCPFSIILLLLPFDLAALQPDVSILYADTLASFIRAGADLDAREKIRALHNGWRDMEFLKGVDPDAKVRQVFAHQMRQLRAVEAGDVLVGIDNKD